MLAPRHVRTQQACWTRHKLEPIVFAQIGLLLPTLLAQIEAHRVLLLCIGMGHLEAHLDIRVLREELFEGSHPRLPPFQVETAPPLVHHSWSHAASAPAEPSAASPFGCFAATSPFGCFTATPFGCRVAVISAPTGKRDNDDDPRALALRLLGTASSAKEVIVSYNSALVPCCVAASAGCSAVAHESPPLLFPPAKPSPLLQAASPSLLLLQLRPSPPPLLDATALPYSRCPTTVGGSWSGGDDYSDGWGGGGVGFWRRWWRSPAVLVEAVPARGRLASIVVDVNERHLLVVVTDAVVCTCEHDLALPTLVCVMTPGHPDRVACTAADVCRHVCRGRLVRRHVRLWWRRP